MNRKQIPAVILRNAYTFRKQCAFGGNYLSILFILHHLPLLSPLITTKPLQHFIVIDRLAQVLLGSQLLHDLLEMKRTSRCGYITFTDLHLVYTLFVLFGRLFHTTHFSILLMRVLRLLSFYRQDNVLSVIF